MTATDTYLFLRAMVDEFARCGMRNACASPGSRNTPIVLTLASEDRIRTWSHIDERAAGFFALGIAKATGRPVAVTCTSGTAAANLLPAVIEAHEAALPLIVLTADRPPELRDVGAGQTIDQVKLYGDAVKLFVDPGVPEASPDHLRWARSLACRAYLTATRDRPGPVHINLPLREPLVLDKPLPGVEPGGGGHSDGSPWVVETGAQSSLSKSAASRLNAGSPSEALAAGQRSRQRSEESEQVSESATSGDSRPVIVAGELGGDLAERAQFGAELAAAAAAAGIPLLADPRSGARRGETAITYYDLLLRHRPLAVALAPTTVYRVGDLPTSKPLRAWLAGLDGVEQVTIAGDDRWPDPSASVTRRERTPLQTLLAPGTEAKCQLAESGWLARWQRADATVAGAIAPLLEHSGLSEPVVARTLAAAIPATDTLFVAASMPIRDVEEVWPASASQPQVLANRGVNGIDGTISTALGVAASGTEVVLLLGDVAMTHDLSALTAVARGGIKLTVVLINNNGGGIFDFLPVAATARRDQFERLLATPPSLNFELAAKLFGLGHVQPHTPAELAAALQQALAGSRSTLIEVSTDRAINRALHAQLEQVAIAALDGAGDR
jgi:2-succinyl-5-enolpyruvyl-6-hydroxy-3-cyclohexene-1-carboxylate synthase